MVSAELINVITVNRKQLIAQIEARVAANQKVYEAAVADFEANDLSKAIDREIEKMFPNPMGQSDADVWNLAGNYTRANAKSAKNTLLNYLGKARTVPVKPFTCERELAILGMSDDETLTLPTNHQYFNLI